MVPPQGQDTSVQELLKYADQGEDRTKRIDDYSVTDKTYIGVAESGASTSDAVWKIKVIDETGSDVVTKWADGDSEYDNVWDNRTSLSYS